MTEAHNDYNYTTKHPIKQLIHGPLKTDKTLIFSRVCIIL